MKLWRRITAVLAIALLIAGLCACGSSKTDGASETESSAEDIASFYSLEKSGKRLKISLETDIAAGYNWTYKITDESILNMTGFEFDPGDSEDEKAPGTWKGTFASMDGKFGDIKLMLYNVRDLEDVETADPVYTLDINVSADGTISVKSVTE